MKGAPSKQGRSLLLPEEKQFPEREEEWIFGADGESMPVVCVFSGIILTIFRILSTIMLYECPMARVEISHRFS